MSPKIVGGGQTYGPVWNFQVENCTNIDDVIHDDLSSLLKNVPNPFNNSTEISFTLNEASKVDLDVYNVHGQKIKTLMNEVNMASGIHVVDWDGKDDLGRIIANGIYICRLKTDGKIATREMLYVK